MDQQFRDYLEEKFSGLNRRLDDLSGSVQRDSEGWRDDKREIYARLGALESRQATVEASRPTYSQLLAAVVTAVALAVSIATIIIQILG